MSSNSVEAQLQEQKKIIAYLTSKYEKDTGRRLPLPTSLGQLLGDPSILGSGTVHEEETKAPPTFNQQIDALNLPKPPSNDKRQANRKKDVKFEAHHMIAKINMSNCAYSISRMGMRQLVDGIDLLPCMRSLNLSGNMLTDDYEKEILSIFDNKRIVAIDLSKNLFKKLGMQIGKKLKDECQQVVWFDISQNDFDGDAPTVAMLINGLKKQKELIYVGLSTRGI